MSVDKLFINEFMTIGMNDYLDGSVTSFEQHIMECLAEIYGEDELKVGYYNGENAFNALILKYGLKPTVYESFLRDSCKYEAFKRENAQNLAIKSDLASVIEISIITMFLQKSLISTPTLGEISHFENTLLNNFSIIKLHFNTSLNPNRTREYWAKKKKILSSNVELSEVKPTYLDESVYQKFGVNINDVKQMDYRMVNELNNYIQVSNSTTTENPEKKKLLWNTAISSGSGFVDGLMILSIMVTEICVGLIIIFSHM